MALTASAALSEARLREAVKVSARVASAGESPRVLAVAVPLADCDPLAGFARFESEDRFYWEQAARGLALAGSGAVLVHEAQAEDAGFGPTAAHAASTGAAIADAYLRIDCVGGAAPLFVGGFAFEARGGAVGDWERFPAGRMVLPEVLLRREAGHSVATVCIEVEPGADPDPLLQRLQERIESARGFEAVDGASADFGAPASPRATGRGAEYRVVADRDHATFWSQVEAALTSIRVADLEKVVLARSLEVTHPGRFDLASFLHELRVLYPHCTVLACGRGEDTLVAASPELLVSLDAGDVESCALAGSAARGRSPEEDAALGQALRESKKEQAEHEAVVRAIRAGLAPWAGELQGPEAPELMQVLGIQHLSTRLRGRLRAECSDARVLDLVASLHPTPAVGGLPRAAALDWIRDHEALDRGWYAGPIGWVDASGGGEFWLALRSALVRNAEPGSSRHSRARLFAGAGLVQGSQPDAELRETRLKLRALLAPLTEI